MNDIIICLAYIHPDHTWHYKAFANIISARSALIALAKRNIPVVYADFRNTQRKMGVYGASEEVFIDTFIQLGGEHNIAHYLHNDDPIPEMIWNWIANKTINDTVVINGHIYIIEEDCFKQDEMRAEAYNSYGGFDKVLRWTVTSATDEEVYVEFYTDEEVYVEFYTDEEVYVEFYTDL